jgi:hypothetical protein
MFGSRVLRNEATAGLRKLQNEELHNLYSLPIKIKMIISRRLKLEGHEVRMREKRIAYRILVG